jgi:spermidine synthase
VLGSVSGRLFAVSTAGSLLAALATGFLLLPNFGVKTILGSTGCLLIVLAGAGLLWERSRLAGVAALTAAVSLALLPPLDRVNQPKGFRVLARIPSFYGLIRVIEDPTFRVLTVDGVGQNYVAIRGKGELTPYLAFVSALPRLHQRPDGPPRSALVVGLGAGQLVGLLEAAGVRVDVVEIDPKIDQTTRRYFGFTHPAERVHIADGRIFLEREVSRYDYVILDAFLGEDIPWHLFTVQALEATRDRLAAGGLLVVNYTSVPHGRDVAAIGATLRRVFPHVSGFSEGCWDQICAHVYLAAESPIELAAEAVSALEGRAMIRAFLRHELPVVPGTVLTDDFNPINTYRVAASRSWREAMIRSIGADWTFWADF